MARAVLGVYVAEECVPVREALARAALGVQAAEEGVHVHHCCKRWAARDGCRWLWMGS